MRRAIAILLSLAAGPVAGDVSFEWPVDCTLGDDCYIQHAKDNDPTQGVSNAYCTTLAYDGHKGTDIAIDAQGAADAGVSVFAAADGVVAGVRDGMDDIYRGAQGAPDIAGRECGNGVVIQHDDGLETQYCHLAKGSVAVSGGQVVAAGDRLGFIGRSGNTQFPHLHFEVRQRGETVDPFDVTDPQSCDDPLDPLWADDVALPPTGIIAIGVADNVPTYDAVKNGSATTGISTSSPALVGWSYIFHGQSGDIIRAVLTGPFGTVIDQNVTLEKDQHLLFRAMGRRKPAEGWPTGPHTLTTTLHRNGATMDVATHDFIID